jgi:hypothetical protein
VVGDADKRRPQVPTVKVGYLDTGDEDYRRWTISNGSCYYQFAGISSKTIADRSVVVEGKDLDESTVLKEFKAAAKLIGWNHLRQSRQNRKTR